MQNHCEVKLRILIVKNVISHIRILEYGEKQRSLSKWNANLKSGSCSILLQLFIVVPRIYVRTCKFVRVIYTYGCTFIEFSFFFYSLRGCDGLPFWKVLLRIRLLHLFVIDISSMSHSSGITISYINIYLYIYICI